MKTHYFISVLCTLLALGLFKVSAQQTVIVNASAKGAPIQTTQWGIFFEDINFALDGGLYAELVKNRSFEFDKPFMGWKEKKETDSSGRYEILNRYNENNTNQRFLRVIKDAKSTTYALINEGYRGMGFKPAIEYHLSLNIRTVEGSMPIRAELIDQDGAVISSGEIIPDDKNWKKYSLILKAPADTVEKGQLRLSFMGRGKTDIDFISLFPSDTWKNRQGGLRSDLVQVLYDLKPGFVRFPGGCVVEGRTLNERYQWKQTLNSIEERKTMVNRWNMEFSHKLTPDYYQSYGIGFYEYFQLAEDLQAEPLPILSCGMACQYNTAELAQLSDMQPFIDDALDLIEFANGDTTTQFGKIRARMGHPAPFNMHFIGIGNEQWGPQYIERYKMIADAIQNKHPEIKLIGSVGPSADGTQFNYLWSEMEKLKPALVDEHYYMSPDWFLKNARRYDNYNRNNPKVFAGEFAAHSDYTCSPNNKSNWYCALAEAAFMTGLERNADVVYMASYAPLFGHLNAWQWSPNLIWFDNICVFPTINYQVQKIFSNNKGTVVIPATINNKSVAGEDGLYISSAIDEAQKEIVIKIVNTNSTDRTLKIKIEGLKPKKGLATLQLLQCNNLDTENFPGSKSLILPQHSNIKIESSLVEVNSKNYSLSIYRIKY